MQIKIRMKKSSFLAKKLRKKVATGTFKSLYGAAGAVRTTASRSIRKSPKPSASGSPPHSKTGMLRKAIKFYVDRRKATAIIGPDAAIVGRSGSAHEHGGLYRGDQYDKRPFMGPALMKMRNRLPRFWAASVR